MNASALIAVVIFASALLAIFGAVYVSASRSHAQGEIGSDGLRMLRWALGGHVVLFALLAITVFLT